MSRYAKNIQNVRNTAQRAVGLTADADKLLLEGKLATASGRYEKAAEGLQLAAKMTREAIVARELERESEDQTIEQALPKRPSELTTQAMEPIKPSRDMDPIRPSRDAG